MAGLSKARLAQIVGTAGFFLAVGLAEKWEGKRNYAYQDIGGVWTICYGHTKGVKRGDWKTDEECHQLLIEDMAISWDEVDRMITIDLPGEIHAALADFNFNMGAPRFATSTLRKMVNAGDFKGACDEVRKWVMAAGKRWQGLANRREDERRVCRMAL